MNNQNESLNAVVTENEPLTTSALIKRWLKRKLSLLVVLFLIIALLLAFFWQRIIITIHPGEAGILFRRFTGTEIDKIYEEGLHVFNPLDTLYIYEIRKQVAYHDFTIITNKGLNVNLSLAVRYRPEYDLLGLLHQRIGPDYLNRVILPQIESVMRKQLGQYSAEQIYTNEEGLLTNAILTALDEVGRNYVEVEDIIIRSISLPPNFVEAIESKLKQEEFMKSYEFRLETAQKEAERLAIMAQGIQKYQATIDQSLTESVLRHQGIEATKELALSHNAKIVVIGSGETGLPLILNTGSSIPRDTDKVVTETEGGETIPDGVSEPPPLPPTLDTDSPAQRPQPGSP